MALLILDALAVGIGAVLGFPAGWLAGGRWSRHHGRNAT